jgi:uncharacterized protein
VVCILRKNINENLEDYIEKEIIPQYNEFDSAHDLEHVNNVIDYALQLGDKFSAVNQNIIYTAASYHDLGLSYGQQSLEERREKHHQYSAKLVEADQQLKEFFSPTEIETISRACYQHRASFKEDVTELTSKIIADADRMDGLNIKRMIIRSWKYSLEQDQQKSVGELYSNMYLHLLNKYGKDGYAYQSFYLSESKELFHQEIETAQRTLAQKNKFKTVFKSLIKKEKINIS